MYFDKTGNNPTWWQWILFGIGVALVIIASGMTIVGTGGVASFGVGALLGSLSLGAVGATIGGAVGYATGGTEGILGGVLAGFGIGSIIGFVVGGVIGYSAHKLDPDTAMIKEALKKLDKSGLRPGQDRISKSRVMELYKNYDPLKANSSITNLKNTRYLVNGHHTTVANVMRGGNTSFGMGTYCTDIPSATNVYWIKKWYEFGKIAIKIIP